MIWMFSILGCLPGKTEFVEVHDTSGPPPGDTAHGDDTARDDTAETADTVAECGGVGSDCPCDVMEEAGHVYLFCTDGQPWSDALAFCRSYGYDLAAIHSAGENEFLRGETASHSSLAWWIGLSDVDSEGVFVWSNGDPVDYTNWGAGEPNDNRGDEDCGELPNDNNETWNDGGCVNANSFVCESL